MTLTLILTRHAKSDWGDGDLDDHDRPLNPRGRTDAPRIGRWLRAAGHVPDQALVSSARRAQETWQGIAPELGDAVAMETCPDLYHAAPETMLARLHRATGTTVIMIGHNPGIGTFAHRILVAPVTHPAFADYPTAATLVVRFDAPDWRGVTWRTGEAMGFVAPRDL